MEPRARFVLPVALVVQAAVLLPRLGALPIWGDEQVTLDVINAPIGRMLVLLAADTHPPLYFLFLKAWVALLPLEVAPIIEVRLWSVVLTLIATVVVDRLWLRDVSPRVRIWFLVLWVLSPFLLLYGRMGRSYSAQIVVTAVAVRYVVAWFRRADPATAIRCGVAQAALMYTHYAPGLSLAAVVGLGSAPSVIRGERARTRGLLAMTAICAALYLPWTPALVTTLAERFGGDVPPMAGPVTSALLRLGYTFMSVSVGETLPLAALAVAALLVPLAIWMTVEGLQKARGWPPVVLGMTIVAYVAVALHVVPALTPARLAFALPFGLLALLLGCERRPAIRAVLLPAMVALSAVGAASYYQQRNFLNKAYLIPFAAIAAEAASELGQGDLLVVDASNMDATPLVAALPASVPRSFVANERDVVLAARRLIEEPVTLVWLLRNTHDVSPEGWSTRMREALARMFRCGRRGGYVRYDPADELAMRALGWPGSPDFVLEIIECSPPPPAARAGRDRAWPSSSSRP